MGRGTRTRGPVPSSEGWIATVTMDPTDVTSLLERDCILGALIYFAASWMCGHSVATPCLSVRLFSRSAQSNYDWFMEQLRGDTFKDLVKETKPFYISNSNRYEFMEEIHKCNFAVLYHTKHEGRINITNVTDSLYDEELKELFDALGKKNVIVLIDDLDSSGYGEKFQILETQPDMKNLAEDVFLFSEAEKKDPKLVEDKLQHIKFIMSSGSGEMTSPVRMEKLCTFLFSMASWLFNSITYIMSVSTWQRNLRAGLCQCCRRTEAPYEAGLCQRFRRTEWEAPYEPLLI
ncbi:uncharacterized protein LOC734410 isoform X2 [Xenopus laevis]|uniref:Uncharacterized protein LOC734410 isoform X2 n=2 Tax=Xenopus laevis TaxID=8355 RepID=A0A8J1LQ29_XENLA|nr:uncharacterized protein LOC734410 isoform X2 [Xenopus laevis]